LYERDGKKYSTKLNPQLVAEVIEHYGLHDIEEIVEEKA
jgi:hypothetical protein